MLKTFLTVMISVTLSMAFIGGCATSTKTPDSGATQSADDQIVVNAEKATQLATDTFDTFLKLEYDNRVAVKRMSPEAHEYAEFVRRNGPGWLKDAREMTKAYKNNRTAQNKANMMTAIAVIQTAITKTQTYLVRINNP